MKGSHVRVSQEQREIMLRYMEEHPGMAQNKFCGLQGAATRHHLWADLTSHLNACSTGGSKSTEKWIKSWQEWKSDVKLKGQRHCRHAKGTEGGPPLPPLTELEERLIKMIGYTASRGVEGIPDPLNRLPENSTAPFAFRHPSSTFPCTITNPSSSILSTYPNPPSPIPSTFPLLSVSSTSSLPSVSSTSSHHIPARRGKKRKERRDDSYALMENRLAAAAEETAAYTGKIAAAAERRVEVEERRNKILEDFCSKIAAIVEKQQMNSSNI